MIDKIINLELLAHPVNWGIVLAVLMISGYALTVTAEAVGGGKCSCNSDS